MSASSIRAEIEAERARQLQVEGYSAQHDDRYRRGVLARAAECYIEHAMGMPVGPRGAPVRWPWPVEAWKPKDARRDLIRAGALLLAEKARETRTRRLTDLNRHRAAAQMERAVAAVVRLVAVLDAQAVAS